MFLLEEVHEGAPDPVGGQLRRTGTERASGAGVEEVRRPAERPNPPEDQPQHVEQRLGSNRNRPGWTRAVVLLLWLVLAGDKPFFSCITATSWT